MQGIFVLVVYIVGAWMVLKGLSKLIIIALNKFQVLSTEIQTKGSKIVVGDKEIYTYIKSDIIKPIETEIVYSLEEAQNHYQKMTERGFEGSVVKDREAKFENKRSTKQIKLKAEKL